MNQNAKPLIYILLTFMVAIFISYIPDEFPKFFGDWLCEGHFKEYEGCLYDGIYQSALHNSKFHWGYRHWLWFSMGWCLFILQVYRIILILSKEENAKP